VYKYAVKIEVEVRELTTGDTLLVAWAEGRPVGRLELRWRGSKHDHIVKLIGRVPEICRMWVSEQYRGNGIAGDLLDCAKRLAETRGDRHVGLAVGVDNHSALAAYEKAAFARLGAQRFTSPFGQNGSHTVVYMTASTNAPVYA
jgi:GNAT superfamily N-acetyltransferase